MLCSGSSMRITMKFTVCYHRTKTELKKRSIPNLAVKFGC